jgi:hypothetical protein
VASTDNWQSGTSAVHRFGIWLSGYSLVSEPAITSAATGTSASAVIVVLRVK